MSKIIVFKNEDLKILETTAKFKENGSQNCLYLCLKCAQKLECLIIQNASQNLAQNLEFAYFEGALQEDFFVNLNAEWLLNLESNFIKFKPIFEQENGVINISFASKIHASILKISSQKPLFALKFTLFARKIKGLMLAPRDDFYGSRLLAMTNALYLAQKTGFKFGFVWATCKCGDDFLGDESEYFTQDFIEKFSYTKSLEARSYGNFRIRSLCEFDALNANGGAQDYGWICCFNDSLEKARLRDLDGDDYRKNFRKNFLQLDFVPKYKQVFSKAKETAKTLKNFVALHLRGGDVVFTNTQLIFKESHINRLFPPQIAAALIEKFIKAHNIVLFCKDKDVARAIKSAFEGHEHRVFVGDEFADEGFETAQKDFFDMYLMSYAELIIAPKRSTFSLIASLLGDCKLVSFGELISDEESFGLINAHFEDFEGLHPMQKAATSAFLYALALRLNKDEKTKMQILLNALKYDKKNEIYKALILENVPRLLDFMGAENVGILQDAATLRAKNSALQGEFSALCDKFSALQKDFTALQNSVCVLRTENAKLQKEYQNALTRHKKFLSYRLGNALIKAYKTPLHSGLIKFAFCDAWRIYKDFKAKIQKCEFFVKNLGQFI